MAVIREVIETIDFWSPPLKKHRYQMGSIKRKAFISSGEGSGLLIEELRERDRIASGVLTKHEEVSAPPAGVLIDSDIPVAPVQGESPEVPEPPKRRFRAIKRMEELLYDDTLVKQGQLEDEAYDVLNEDGFYDEVLPIDFDEDIVDRPQFEYKEVALLFAAFAALVGVSVFIVMKFVL